MANLKAIRKRIATVKNTLHCEPCRTTRSSPTLTPGPCSMLMRL
jgi:hypothetical protein